MDSERAWKVATNTVGFSYNLNKVPELSDQKDKFGRCSTKINQPMSDSSCGNLNKQAAICLGKQQEGSKTRNLASVGITGTGDIDPKEVPQLCAVWCAEAACPFSTLVDASHKVILHLAVLKHLPTRKAVSKNIHLLYSAIQDSYRTILKEHQGALYLSVDTWQSPNGFDLYAGVIEANYNSFAVSEDEEHEEDNKYKESSEDKEDSKDKEDCKDKQDNKGDNEYEVDNNLNQAADLESDSNNKDEPRKKTLKVPTHPPEYMPFSL
ncbi:hypothetical protein PGTUg99_022570 [Puccinia graminis f. sp. tritici]|uniref:Uncharacterized protein n=1 Tax=Puccinia graminis f. sp. tritici TaxID=56615 RepID=A0A5B0MY33_PUCGR|nr:hypothetical protein PGTUg99_022570 [Puccinia graminis f. sp. tritici]